MRPITTEAEFGTVFPDETACREQLFHIKWPDGYRCPVCGSSKYSITHSKSGQQLFQCSNSHCKHQTSLTANTLMHKTRLPLLKWFLAIFLVVRTITGLSAKELQRRLDVSYPTAWYLLHRIRKAMNDPSNSYRVSELVSVHYGCVSEVVNPSSWRAFGIDCEPYIIAKTNQDRENQESGQNLEIPSPRIELYAVPGLEDCEIMVAEDEPHVVSGSPRPSKSTDYPIGSVKQNTRPGNPSQSLFRTVSIWLASVFQCSVGRHLQKYLDEYAYRYNRIQHHKWLVYELTHEIMTHPPLFYHRLVGIPSRSV